MTASLSLAVDIGGTFTDFVLSDPGGRAMTVTKVASTPENLAEAVLEGITRLGVDVADVGLFVHGTTVGLNAVIQNRGARTALITTQGFRDVYAIGRTDRPEMYNLLYRKPRPLVARRDVLGVDERVNARGEVVKRVSQADLHTTLREIQRRKLDAVAVCTLHAYGNPSNEQRIGRFLADRAPELHVSLSHEVANEWREYERTSTTVLNAYLAPVVGGYLAELQAALSRRGFRRRLAIMQSNGGLMAAQAAERKAVYTLLSGPVGGAVGAREMGCRLNRCNLIAMDMGGTSFDVSLLMDGILEVTTESSVMGHPLLVPMLKIGYCGAGGGSVAYLEEGGSLRVGPQSAGAEPGPACYGRGGRQPTVTDANVILGRLHKASFSSSKVTISPQLAEQSIAREIAAPLGWDVRCAADAILRIAVSKMAYAVREVTVEQGLDPRDFALLAFGGAGPMHAAEIAEEIGISEVIVPPVPGAFCAWGMLASDFRHDLVQPILRQAEDVSSHDLASMFQVMQGHGSTVLQEQGVPRDEIRYRRSLDLRYRGQEHTLLIPLPDDLNESDLKSVFDVAHERKFGYRLRDNPIEMINGRLGIIGQLTKPPDGACAIADRSGHGAIVKRRPVHFGGVPVDTVVLQRDNLRVGDRLGGPAIVEERTATTVLPPGWHLAVDNQGNLVMRRQEKTGE